MGLKNDRWVREMASQGMITPFSPTKVSAVDGRSVLSYGVESYGYTLQVSDRWRVVDPTLSSAQLAQMVVDPRDPATLERVMTPVFTAPYIDVAPHSFVLTCSAERWRIPRNVLCVVLGKSSYARVAMLLNVTPLEPEWGSANPAGGDYITLEISNTAPFPIRVYAHEGIGQVLFFEGDEPPMRGYGAGRYQGQDDITLPR